MNLYPQVQFAAVLLLALGLAGCTASEASPVDPVDLLPRVRVAEVVMESPSRASRHLVLLEPARRARLGARFGGQVERVRVQEQQRVPVGKHLVALDDDEARAAVLAAESALTQAQAQAADAERELQIARDLAEQGAGAARPQERAEAAALGARAAVQQAEAGLIQAKDRLEASILRAPFAGRVVRIDTERGEFLMPGVPVVVVADLDTLALQVPLSDREAAQHDRDGLSFEVRVRGELIPAGPDWVASEAAEGNTTFPARLTIDNAGGLLRAGETAEIVVTSHSAAADSPAVPSGAVRWSGSAPYVLRLDGDRLELQAVEVLEDVGGLVTLAGPLQPGDLVVSAGPNTLADGDPVVVVTDAG